MMRMKISLPCWFLCAAACLLAAGCEPEKLWEDHSVPVRWHEAAGDGTREFSEDALADKYQGETRRVTSMICSDPPSPIEHWEMVELATVVFYFSQPAETDAELRKQVECGTYDEWLEALGIGEGTEVTSRMTSPLSETFVIPGGRLAVVRGSRFPAILAVQGDGSFSGRVWDRKRGVSWGVQGSNRGGPADAGKPLEMLLEMMPR